MLCYDISFEYLQNIHLALFLVYKVHDKICLKWFWILYHKKKNFDEMFNFRIMICCVLQEWTKRDKKIYKLMFRCVWISGTGVRNIGAYEIFEVGITLYTVCSVSVLWGGFPKTDNKPLLAWFQASHVIWMQSSFFWAVAQCWIVVPCWCFRTSCWSHGLRWTYEDYQVMWVCSI